MCGIAALIKRSHERLDAGAIARMTRLVAHRGPDGEGLLAVGGPSTGASSGGGALFETALDDARAHVLLGHRRLSIIDLSSGGRQPMRRGPASAPLWISYNGELFNYVEVQRELRALGHEFVSSSDTEVLLAAWQQWGPDALPRLRGMWGFVIVDGARRQVFCARDRMGIKPLYLFEAPQLVAVASEIKQLAAVTALVPDDTAVGRYLQTGFEDPDRSMFERVRPLPAATWCRIDLDGGAVSAPERYWHPERVVVSVTDVDEAARRFDEAFVDSVRIHMRSDVPVGCALSGGLDSSAVCAVAREILPVGAPGAALHSFQAVFPGFAQDEDRYGSLVAEHLRTTHHKTAPTAADALADLDRFLWCHDEPPGSLSQYAAYAVARATKNAGVPVSQNGQGGDEVLGGYWQTTFLALAALRNNPVRLAQKLVPAALPGGNREVFLQAAPMLRRFLSRTRPDDTIRLVRAPAGDASPAQRLLSSTPREQRLYGLLHLTLPRLLKWDDRNFMAFAVEGRYPFLDHVVMETCLSFSDDVLFVGGWTKEPLRRAMAHRLPRAIVRRRGKIGFETPQAGWLAGAWRGVVELALGAGASPLFQYAERASVRALLDAVGRKTASREQSQALVRAFLVDRWLRTHVDGAAAGEGRRAAE